MIYVFSDCILDADSRELRRAGQVVAIEPKVFQVLLYLLQHRDRIVTKDDLFAHCWPETFVSEAALTRCLAKVRQVVQPGRTGEPIIKTVHRQGYRFVAVVTTAEDKTSPEQAAVPLPRTARAEPLPTTVPAASGALAPLARFVDASSTLTPARRPSTAERRQVTILCCMLADAARLARQLDPEDLHGLVQGLHTLGAEVVQRWGGHLAQYLRDGLLAYFGYPQAQEHDAERAVRAGLEIVEGLAALHARLAPNAEGRIAVQIGIHTGSVVIGELGSVALGTTPDVAASLATLAAPDTVVISAETTRLVEGYFVWEALGEHQLPGATSSMAVYRVLHESGVQTRFEVMATRGLTPLVGREPEVGLLLERWALARDGLGQVVLLSGEAGIGKSRLVRVLTERIMEEGAPRVTFRCSPYHTNSALSPVLEHLQQFLHFHREDEPQARLDKLEQGIEASGLPRAEVMPLFAALLSVPLLDRYAPLCLTPEQQKQKTLETLVRWLLLEAERQPVLTVWEDLHWADPSTLELLSLTLDQTPTARQLHLLTCRPEFQPPWSSRAHLTSLTLTRLSHSQVQAMVERLTSGKALPPEVVQLVVTKTDGVPLFVEELTKAVLEAGVLREIAGSYELTGPVSSLAIPTTLHDSLMARLDRLTTAKAVAQLGATLGRQFSYDLLQAVSPLDEATLQRELGRLVEAELLYQRGIPPQAMYQFKHALIQDAAYQSLLRSTRRQYHQRIAQVLVERFPETTETQPEVVAQHYTAADLHAQAVLYWQRAGQRALERSAYHEAVASLERGLEALTNLPQNRVTLEQAIDLRLALRTALWPSYDFGRILTCLRETETLAMALDDPRRLGQVLVFLSIHYFLIGAHEQYIAAVQSALALATASGEVVLHALANQYLGQAYYVQGDYHRAVDCLGQTVTSLDGARCHERFGQAVLPAVFSRIWLAKCHAELGIFAEGSALGDEGLRIAETAAHPVSVMCASWGLGLAKPPPRRRV